MKTFSIIISAFILTLSPQVLAAPGGAFADQFAAVATTEVDQFGTGIATSMRFNDLIAGADGAKVGIHFPTAFFPNVSQSLRTLLGLGDPLPIPQLLIATNLFPFVQVSVNLVYFPGSEMTLFNIGGGVRWTLVDLKVFQFTLEGSFTRESLSYTGGNYEPLVWELGGRAIVPVGGIVNFYVGLNYLGISGTLTATGINQTISKNSFAVHPGIRLDLALLTLAGEYEYNTALETGTIWASLGLQF